VSRYENRERVPCWFCDGSGWHVGLLCPACGGFGYHLRREGSELSGKPPPWDVAPAFDTTCTDGRGALGGGE